VSEILTTNQSPGSESKANFGNAVYIKYRPISDNGQARCNIGTAGELSLLEPYLSTHFTWHVEFDMEALPVATLPLALTVSL
jgi:hypothetical protein